MRKYLITHLAFLLAFFLLITLLKHWFSLIYLYFWAGGMVGFAFPLVDHLLYAYVLRPEEVVSERIRYMIRKRELKNALNFIILTRHERSKLILHTAYFQAFFFVLAFWVITSSGSIFGRGLVLAFSLHLFIDQVIDFMDKRDIGIWFKDLPIIMDQQKIRIYMITNILLLCFLGFFL
ncbi:hypothetical protein A2141_05905 [Candidatus Woesebacteria bacterium RBG_16_40_11]|uniref:Uncharacterized protein n=1 Tax=Candidatus Woesebacteria bacterium RIFCSPHIGHO2_01_FULL_40_22 TaxID=1802499 RepID=A0A1F7YIR8_9BACT|nr:MAG: hypothetical protein A2141_05905 [Candidatus Woesebacteria bacterium RBG_16_40_11]OGM27173.1 MAG: hypothetical protein A2628_03995 [Candidatus Woesebacteria bacterium RIFCSPHIGHO2_01_FULL_40_22]